MYAALLICFISALSVLNFAAQNCEYNYAFVIDESGSVRVENYIPSIDFIIELIELHIAKTANLMSLSFSDSHDFQYTFGQPQSTRKPIIEALEKEKSDYGGGWTHTEKAMTTAIAEFKKQGFTTNNIVILVTDGQPQDKPCSITDDLRDNNIRVIIVGVGGFSPSAVECLVLGNANDVIEIANFDFQPVIKQLEQGQIVCTCNEDGIGKSCSRDADCSQYGECMMCCKGTKKCHRKPEFKVVV